MKILCILLVRLIERENLLTNLSFFNFFINSIDFVFVFATDDVCTSAHRVSNSDTPRMSASEMSHRKLLNPTSRDL